MKENILIVEDEFIVANDLRIMLQKAGYAVCGIAPSVPKAMDLIKAKSPDWVLLDIFLQGDKTGIDLAGYLTDVNIPFIYISANTNQTILNAAKETRPYGFLVKPFREKDLLIMLDIAQYRHQQSAKYDQGNDTGLQRKLENIAESGEGKTNQLKQLALAIQSLVPFDLMTICPADSRDFSDDLNLLQVSPGIFDLVTHEGMLNMTGISARDLTSWKSARVLPQAEHLFNASNFSRLRMDNLWIKALSDTFQLGSAMVLNTSDEPSKDYRFIFYSKDGSAYTLIHKDLLAKFGDALTQTIVGILTAKPKVKEVAPQKEASVTAVKTVIAGDDFHGIVGKSPLLIDVFHKIEMAAPDDTSILILGESGTGKERIAHTIHQLSPRKAKPIITVNCAALPITLIESELFGHEKGAFTGANDRRIGKFEQADGGTIFLDEIGELPLEAQVKLLRVLQEREIERLGGSLTKKINVRIITATNRNLEKEVAEGRFRLDLYYRLNVFPIELPALRQRKDDIPLLANYFLTKYARKSNKAISRIGDKAMEELKEYEWPGNIRELEHLIERSILMTSGDTINQVDIPVIASVQHSNTDENFRIKTLDEMERDHILSILKMCRGKVFGPGGAAEVLNIPSTTLNSKIKKLGIKYEYTK